ncbi:MAG: ACT domain-containing protein [Methanobacteriota archaeon]|nr:MAG: ACT domain-containing protein [Euryarchaeota archaeon]
MGYDPLLTRDIADRLGIELVEFETLLKESDIITIHVPKIPETINLLNARNFSLCKKGVVLINCARGGIVNEADLLKALESGQVSMAALDVFEKEPPENRELIEHPRVIATPHLGASTEEAQTKVADQILQQMVEYFRKGVALNAVNYISVDEKIQPVIAPYYKLAQLLGSFSAQVRKGRLTEVAIRFYGEVAGLPLEPIASHLMVGALKRNPVQPESHDVDMINMVNALTVAREKGIEIEISRKDHPLTSHTNLIACDFLTDEGMVHLTGTVYARDIYRLVEFNSYVVDADLTDKMIIVENEDVPGIIGKIGTLLGDAGINISHVSSGRVQEENMAVNIFNVEGEIGKDLLTEVESIKHIQRSWFVDMTLI